ncbi:hypothetical protein OIE49_35080 [Streptomyces sp. NBC_01788]|uniref:hypothetical protein n=1 Tax=unclassified Streptomyces TaxID=2593676 RepID=UPI002DD7DADD|nr:hypothetical protein [Streptomyces sp. NBC_01788]WSB30668.1 hypothetical protein OIE49_35080 [Streptomyces sp. NBC_01788]
MTSYIRTQGTIAAIINVVVNSLITWLSHHPAGFVPLTGNGSMVIDVFITSIVLPLLVSLSSPRECGASSIPDASA